MSPIIIFGTSDLGKLALSLFSSQGIVVYCLLDDDLSSQNELIDEVSVMGQLEDEAFIKMLGKQCGAFIALENPRKKEIIELLNGKKQNIPFPNAIHQTSTLASSTSLGKGNLIAMGTYIEERAKIGNYNFIHSTTNIGQAAVVENNTTIGMGVLIGAHSYISEECWVGTGAVISSGLRLGKNVKVLPGSVVMTDVPDHSVVQGNPAKIVKL